jgi:hypothetical protein
MWILLNYQINKSIGDLFIQYNKFYLLIFLYFYLTIYVYYVIEGDGIVENVFLQML